MPKEGNVPLKGMTDAAMLLGIMCGGYAVQSKTNHVYSINCMALGVHASHLKHDLSYIRL